MPSVQEELAALRKQNLTKKNAENLKGAAPLSTPEAEEGELAKTKAKNRSATYAKDAQATLQKGGSAAVDQTTEFQMKAGQAKKSDSDKKKEAAANLQSFNQAKLQANSSAPAPAASAAAEDDDDDVPELEELDDDVPTLEDMPDMGGEAGMPPGMDPAAMQAAAANNEPRTVNRAEKKARRTMEKLGMKKVPGISQCTIKMGGRQGVWQIKAPDVYEKNGAYVVFGEARQGGGMGGQQAMQAQQAMAAQRLAAEASAGGEEPPKIEELDEEEEAIDESGVESKDIELVMSQSGCTRGKAVKALKENG
ncbi:MAG: hypothetical protein SGARI_007190, partial [Bacillariaceae sp.]